MKVWWTPEAEQDRTAIWNHLPADNPEAATRLDALFGKAATTLSRFPNLGRKGRIDGTRELLPHRRYRVIYEIDGDAIWILAIVHTSRQWPPVA